MHESNIDNAPDDLVALYQRALAALRDDEATGGRLTNCFLHLVMQAGSADLPAEERRELLVGYCHHVLEHFGPAGA
jgi:hypothetical protein